MYIYIKTKMVNIVLTEKQLETITSKLVKEGFGSQFTNQGKRQGSSLQTTSSGDFISDFMDNMFGGQMLKTTV
jgi:hypothetical protein